MSDVLHRDLASGMEPALAEARFHMRRLEEAFKRGCGDRDKALRARVARASGVPESYLVRLYRRADEMTDVSGILGSMLRDAEGDERFATTVDIIRQIALTGCRRSEIITLMWKEVDTDASCLRLIDSKEGQSIRPIGLPVIEFLDEHRKGTTGSYVFPGSSDDNAFGSFPRRGSSCSPIAPSRTLRLTFFDTALPVSGETSVSPR